MSRSRHNYNPDKIPYKDKPWAKILHHDDEEPNLNRRSWIERILCECLHPNTTKRKKANTRIVKNRPMAAQFRVDEMLVSTMIILKVSEDLESNF